MTREACAVPQVALANWPARVEHRGVDMNDGLLRLLDLRFSDDLLLFASASTDASYVVDEICAALRAVGLVWNASGTKYLDVRSAGTSPAGHAARLGCGCFVARSNTQMVVMYVVDACRRNNPIHEMLIFTSKPLCANIRIFLRQNCCAATSFTVS